MKSLFDPKFDHFVTPKVISVLYVLSLVLLSLFAALSFLGILIRGEGDAIAVAIVFWPIGYLVSLVFMRISFELISALFRIADDLRGIRRSKGY